MSFFGKIKSAVMRNPVIRDYEIGKQVASAGPGLMWKVHQAVKKSTRQEVSVFIFNKQTPDFEKLHKRQREQILDVLKKGPAHLVRLKHPRILTIDHPLEESSNCLAFATESVSIGLANILGNYDNLPSPLPLAIKEYKAHPIEVQYGLFNLTEALEFLHSGVQLMHGNINPDIVVVTGAGTWKLMGFNFSCYSQYQSDSTTTFEFQEWDSRRPHNTNPSLDFLAPEYILSHSCSEKSDIYSFGMLCYAVYNGGRPLCSSLNNLLSFKQSVETISRVTESGLGEVPHGLRALVRSMLAVEPSVRPDAMEISKHAFFEEVGVATLRYLDTLYEKGDMERSQYFKKNLAMVITKLPKRVIHQRVIPALREEFRNTKMVPFVLPILLLVAEDCTLQEYSDVIMPVLIPALRIQDPIQVPLILLHKMDLLLKKTSPDDIRQHILPTIIASLETSNGQLQELCISLIPSFADTIDYSSMKHSIIPRLTTLMVTAKSVSLLVKCLVAVAKMLDSLDKHILQDHILPLLQQIPSREPGVLMAILGIYHAVLKNKKLGMDKMFLATKVLPFLLPLTVEPALNIEQFNQFMLVVREMLKSLETEQQTHLDQLSKMEEQTKSTVEFAREVSEARAMEDTINKFEETFGAGPHDSHMISRRGATSPGASVARHNPSAMFASHFPTHPPSPGNPPQKTTHPSSHISPLTHTHESNSGKTSPLQPPSNTMNTVGPGGGISLSNTLTPTPLQPSTAIQPQANSQRATPNLLGRSRVSQNETPKSVSFRATPSGPSVSEYTPPAVRSGTQPKREGLASASPLMTANNGVNLQRSGSGMTQGMSSGISTQNQGSGDNAGWSSSMNPQPVTILAGASVGSGINPSMSGGTSTQNQASSNNTGWSSGVSLQPQALQDTGSGGNSIFGGMQLHSGSQPMNQQQAGAAGGPGLISGMNMANQTLQVQGTNQMMPERSHMTGTTNQIVAQAHVTNTPLVPKQVHQTEIKSRSGSGWSSTVDKSGSTLQNQMGWSSGIVGTVQSSNWMAQNPSSTAQLPANQQYPGAQSSNWITPTQTATMQSTNWMPHNQSSTAAPTAASLMMQGGPLLSQGSDHSVPRPPQGAKDNPFADLSFLG